MLKRQLEQEVPTPDEVDRYSFRELIRESLERGLVEDFDRWILFRSQRNATSHTCNENRAHGVFRTALDFVDDARALLNTLRERNAD